MGRRKDIDVDVPDGLPEVQELSIPVDEAPRVEQFKPDDETSIPIPRFAPGAPKHGGCQFSCKRLHIRNVATGDERVMVVPLNLSLLDVRLGEQEEIFSAIEEKYYDELKRNARLKAFGWDLDPFSTQAG